MEGAAGDRSPSSAAAGGRPGASLKDVDLRGSSGAVKLLAMLTSLKNTALITGTRGPEGAAAPEPAGASPFDRDADPGGRLSGLEKKKQDYLEEQAAGSVSSLEGFSPSSHGEVTRGTPSSARDDQVFEIPWVLIPITGLRNEKYCQREKDNPQDPRFLQVAAATGDQAAPRPGSASPPWAARLSPAHQEQLAVVPDDSRHGLARASPSGPRVETPSPPPQSPLGSDSSPPPERSRSPTPPLPEEEDSPMEGQEEEESVMEVQQQQEEELEESPVEVREEQEEEEEENLMEVQQQQEQEEEQEEERPLEVQQEQEEEQEEERPVEVQQQQEDEEKEERPVEVPEEQEEQEEESPVEVQQEQEEERPVEVQQQQEEEQEEERPVELQQEQEEEQEEERPVEVQQEQEEERPVEVQQEQEEERPVEVQQEQEEEQEEERPVEVQQEQEEESLVEEQEEESPVEVQQQEEELEEGEVLDGLDGVVEEQLGVMTSEMQRLLRSEHVSYRSSLTVRPLPHRTPLHRAPLTPLSEYVTFYHTPPPAQGSLRDELASILDSQNVLECHKDLVLGPGHRAWTCADHSNANPGIATHGSTTTHSRDSAPGLSHVHLSVPGPSHVSGPVFDSFSDPPSCIAGSRLPSPPPIPDPPRLFLPQLGSAQGRALDSRTPEAELDSKMDGEPPCDSLRSVSPGEGELSILGTVRRGSPEAAPPGPDRAPTPEPRPAPGLISSLISQLRPEVFSNLEEIMKDVQKKAAQFYIHTTEEENQVHEDIKEHLQRLGNVELSPLNFLDRENDMDKLLIIIQNKDIAGQIHKIPSLVSLKRLPSVVFAGVDSLDDVRNHTYNELFVSGGFIVSDEFILNPDFITQERLLALLMFLEQQSSNESLWRWKVHCKTQKKLREQARFKRDARNILSVLTTYQKRQIVEFLPYHECDMASRQTPDLDCLIRLQAQNVQHRHIIFLTERRFEMFPNYSSSGIVIANIDDFMHRFHELFGFRDKMAAADNPASAQDPEVVRARASPDGVPLLPVDPTSVTERPLPYSTYPSAPPPQAQDFRLPLRDQLVPSTETPTSSLPSTSSEGGPAEQDFEALRLAITQFKAEKAARLAELDALAEGRDAAAAERFGAQPPRPFSSGAESGSLTPALTPALTRALTPALTPPLTPGLSARPNEADPTQQAVAATLSSLACLHSKLGMGGGSESDSEMSLCGSKDNSVFSPPGLRGLPRPPATPPTERPEDHEEVDRFIDANGNIPDTPQSPKQCSSTGNPGPAGGDAELEGGPEPGKDVEQTPVGSQGKAPPLSAPPLPAPPPPAQPLGAYQRMVMLQNSLLPYPPVANLGRLNSHALPLPNPAAMIRGLLPGSMAPNWAGLRPAAHPWAFQARAMRQPFGQSLMGNYATQGGRFRPQRGGFNGL